MGRSDIDRVRGRETVGNSLGRTPLGGSGWTGYSLGRAPVGRSDTGVTTGWTEGRSDDRADGRETVGNSLGSGRETV